MTVEVFLIGALAEAKDLNPREIYEQTSLSVVMVMGVPYNLDDLVSERGNRSELGQRDNRDAGTDEGRVG